MLKRTMLTRILLVSAALVALTAAPAAAQYDDTFTAEIDTTVIPGQDVNVSGTCDSGDEVAMTIGDTGVGSIPVDDDGSFAGPVTAPDLPAGDYVSTATCGDSVLSVDIAVLAAGRDGAGGDAAAMSAREDSDGGLARTGGPIETLAKIGGGLVLVGAAFALLATWRRRSATV